MKHKGAYHQSQELSHQMATEVLSTCIYSPELFVIVNLRVNSISSASSNNYLLLRPLILVLALLAETAQIAPENTWQATELIAFQ